MESVILTCGGWRAEILPRYGMNMVCLQFEGRDILRRPADEQTLRGTPLLYGVPLLLPSNRTDAGRFVFRGRTYQLPINEPEHNNNNHGWMYDAPFQIIRSTGDSLVARYENRGERYPFAFDLTIEDRLTGRGVRREMTLRALEDMPFTLGLHTTFVRPERFDVPRKKQCIRNERLLPTGQWIEAEPLGETFDTCFTRGRGSARLDDVRFAISESFDHWLLFNHDGKQDFLCVEAQCGQVNGLNIPGGHRVLAGGEEESFWFTIELDKDEERKEGAYV